MNTLVPEILVGVGGAIFVGSLLALIRQRTPAGLLTRHPSYRPRAVAMEQQLFSHGRAEGSSATLESALPGNARPEDGAANSSGDLVKDPYAKLVNDDSAERAAEPAANRHEAANISTYRLRRARTIFFMIVGFVTTVWGVATIFTRG